jgi:hypothetical protein
MPYLGRQRICGAAFVTLLGLVTAAAQAFGRRDPFLA